MLGRTLFWVLIVFALSVMLLALSVALPPSANGSVIPTWSAVSASL
jgi:hypothetical protein